MFWRPFALRDKRGISTIEFALILPDLCCDEVGAIAEEIRRAVMALRIVHGAQGAGSHLDIYGSCLEFIDTFRRCCVTEDAPSCVGLTAPAHE